MGIHSPDSDHEAGQDGGYMSWGQISALLTVGGVLIELGAILWILWGVGLGDWLTDRARSARLALRRAMSRIRRAIPWMNPQDAQVVNIAATAEAGSSVSLKLETRRATDRPPPRSLEEAGKRFNQIAEDLNAIKDDLDEGRRTLGAELRQEIELARSDAESRTDAIDELIKTEIHERFVDRKREAIAFSIGVFLQLVGASILLLAW